MTAHVEPRTRRKRAVVTANAAGNSDRYATSMKAAKTATGVARPPNVVIVSTSQ
jgi:hypothetical protein